jgi:hypothetical protein
MMHKKATCLTMMLLEKVGPKKERFATPSAAAHNAGCRDGKQAGKGKESQIWGSAESPLGEPLLFLSRPAPTDRKL